MYKIGIIGSENSHAMAFARIFNGLEADVSYPDIKVVGIGGHYPEESEKVFRECGLDFVADKPEDMLGRVDAVMVTSRNGLFHPGFARPFIEAGLPAFIDKPFANDAEEARALAQLAKDKGVPLAGGSSVKYAWDVQLLKHARETAQAGAVFGGEAAAPLNMHNEYGGFYFYASHLAEMSLTIFGYDPLSVSAFLQGDNVAAVVRYDRYLVANRFHNGNYNYSATLYGEKRTLFREVDISLIYRHECENFAHMLRTGQTDQSYEELILPVYYLNAVERAWTTGVEQKIERPALA